MYHPYSRPGSPSLPNPLLDRALQHRGGSEAKSDSTMAAAHAGRSRNSVSPHPQQRRDGEEGATTSPKSVGRGGGESSINAGLSPRLRTIDDGEGYRNGSSSMRGNALPPMRRSRSPGPNTYPDSRGGSPLPSRGYRRIEEETSRREGGWSSRTHSGMENAQSSGQHTNKRCSDCGRTESEVGLILPLTENGGKQYCKGCCKSVLKLSDLSLIFYSYSPFFIAILGAI
jgi:hypothetical protein